MGQKEMEKLKLYLVPKKKKFSEKNRAKKKKRVGYEFYTNSYY